MHDTIKALLAKAWKKEEVGLSPGVHHVDEEIVVRVTGTVEKLEDDFAASTVSIPLIPTLAYFWDRLGIQRQDALAVLREALHEAMVNNSKEDSEIQARMEDVQAAVKAIRQELIAGLPKMRRDGKVLVDDLRVEVVPVLERAEALAVT